MKTIIPDYKKIYSDMIAEKFPEHKECHKILDKEELSQLDVIVLNNILFNNKNHNKHRSYSEETILEILRFQKKNNWNNSELAKHFNLSRNTVTKWKKYF
ncbi:HTH domain-containing protein [uncultured Chryseobacterium sp.]|uniref:HTH domain-containing protein n=1 Tax=uncultured Chryseobacterium sp. TaxID=259322 RepID=UPI002588C614|nr:HTH domain-containing protein [uncultured Chryseobacterium sp.]